MLNIQTPNSIEEVIEENNLNNLEKSDKSGHTIEETAQQRGNKLEIMHTSARLLSDKETLNLSKITLNEKLLAKNEHTQRNWIFTNFALFDICRKLFPYYYNSQTKQKDEIGLEPSLGQIDIESD